MAKRIQVDYEGKRCYDIQLTAGFDGLVQEVRGLGYPETTKICILSDSNVSELYLEEVREELKKVYPTVTSYVFLAGEASKNLSTVEKVYQHLIEEKFDRKDLMIALGGGVVGDMCGLTAATYLRGIDFIQIPTSLLSQVDSSIGGKTGVDFLQYKNMIGAFYQPKLVYMNLEVLRTLPKEQLYSGIGEILKHGLIKNADYFEWMQEHKDEILALDPVIVEEMIYQSCLIKRDVVQRDPKEQGERALLNFGHTIGHAVEKLSDFTLYHGQCVALGMVSAAYLSWKKGNLTEEEYQKICDGIQDFHLPTQIQDYDVKAVYEATRSDKKMEGDKIKFILLKEIGNAYITKELTKEEICDGIRVINRICE